MDLELHPQSSLVGRNAVPEQRPHSTVLSLIQVKFHVKRDSTHCAGLVQRATDRSRNARLRCGDQGFGFECSWCTRPERIVHHIQPQVCSDRDGTRVSVTLASLFSTGKHTLHVEVPQSPLPQRQSVPVTVYKEPLDYGLR